MKNLKIIGLAGLMLLALVACAQGGDQHAHNGDHSHGAPAEKAEGNQSQPAAPKAAAVEGMNPVVEAYLIEAETLSADKFDAAAAANVVTALEAVAVDPKPDFYATMLGAAKAYAAAADLKDARIKFGALSNLMIDYVDTHECGVALHKAHCPMAPEGIDGTWLQAGEEVHNPWFGSEMYTCGVLQN